MAGPYKPCSIEGCNGNVNHGGARGWCAKHYQRWQKSGDPLFTKVKRIPKGATCSFDGCDKPQVAKGYCSHHYQKFKRYGDPAGQPTFVRQEWISKHKDYAGEDCLTWPFHVSDTGRGVVTVGGRGMSAPRAMCIAAHGKPPTKRHQAAHSCGKGHEGCMNPRHLSWKTPSDNMADMIDHGTLRRGTKVNTNKLTEAQVREIRASVESITALGKRYGVTKQCIYRVRKRLSWAWLDA